jgi:thioredoxin-like negative regulator of GroEL
MGSLPKTMQNVQGFPTLRAYKNTKPVAEFNDARTYEAVVEFIEKYGNNKPKQDDKTTDPSKKKKKTVSKNKK